MQRIIFLFVLLLIFPYNTPNLPTAEKYISMSAKEYGDALITSSMSDTEKIEAIYRGIIEKTYFIEPPADLWKEHCQANKPPTYLYNHALSPIDYGIGSCEDFAAALTLILRMEGFEAEYVSGLTISAKHEFVDHAWTVVCLDGNWYHLDSQLEQNVLQDSKLTYRYFMRDDKWMLADHLWGNWLANYWDGKQTFQQRNILLNDMTPPLCEKIFQQPKPISITLPSKPIIPTTPTLFTKHQSNWEAPIFAIMPK